MFDASSVSLVQVGVDVDAIYRQNNRNFEPRVGIAWTLSENGGTVMRAAFEPRFLKQFPVRTITSYESRPREGAPGGGSPEVDKDVLQDLTTIGYIGGAPSPSPSPTASSSPPAPR